MIQIITGETGEGKTKKMIETAHDKIHNLKGNAIYIDASPHHRFAISHKIRLIEAPAFPLNPSGFIGFLYGLISANHDIEVIFIDELFQLTHCSLSEIASLFEDIKNLSEQHHIEVFVGASCSKKDLPQHLTPYLSA